MGFSRAVNKGYELARGDYIIMATDDCFLTGGSLEDLAVEGTVTSPVIDGRGEQAFSGVMWCVPRDIYEKYGMLDEKYSEGIFFEDEDYWMLLKTENIPHKCINTVCVAHPEGGSTLKNVEEYTRRVNINKIYFNDKWRGKS